MRKVCKSSTLAYYLTVVFLIFSCGQVNAWGERLPSPSAPSSPGQIPAAVRQTLLAQLQTPGGAETVRVDLTFDGRLFVTDLNSTNFRQVRVHGTKEPKEEFVAYRFQEIFVLAGRLFGIAYDEDQPPGELFLHELRLERGQKALQTLTAWASGVGLTVAAGGAFWLDQALTSGSLWQAGLAFCAIEAGSLSLVAALKRNVSLRCGISPLLTNTAFKSEGVRLRVLAADRDGEGTIKDLILSLKKPDGSSRQAALSDLPGCGNLLQAL